VFAPSLENLARIGAVHFTWDETVPLINQLESLLDSIPGASDRRDALGKARGGRLKAADIAERVLELALQTR